MPIQTHNLIADLQPKQLADQAARLCLDKLFPEREEIVAAAELAKCGLAL
jgi:hypothetical protein